MRFLIAAIYLCLVMLCYASGVDFLFFLITLPWSWLLTIFGWLIIHTADDGLKAIATAQLIGGFVNAGIFLVLTSVRTLRKSHSSPSSILLK